MQDTKEHGTSKLNYEDIAAIFTQNTATLLPEENVRQTLAEEKKRFENAAALQISPIKFIGGNTARHCKDLVRRNQPLFWLYLLFSFLMESSMAVTAIMLLCKLLSAGYRALSLPEQLAPSFPAIYILIAVTGIMLYQYISRSIWNHCLAEETDTGKLLKRIGQKKALACSILSLLCIFMAAGIHGSGAAGSVQITVFDTFIFYVACTIISCLHNIIYDSHMISFLCVGAEALNPRTKPSGRTAALYIDRSLQKLLGQTMTSAIKQENESEAGPDKLIKAKTALRSRQLSFRVYAILGLIILSILDMLCIYQLFHVFSLSLLAFSVISLSATLLCIIVILSSHAVLKELAKYQAG